MAFLTDSAALATYAGSAVGAAEAELDEEPVAAVFVSAALVVLVAVVDEEVQPPRPTAPAISKAIAAWVRFI
jgi:hypothetical protein